MRFRPALVLVVATLLAAVAAPADAKNKKPPPLCDTLSKKASAPVLAVLSAFPAELAPLVAATTVEETFKIGDRSYYRGRLAGVHVVLGLLGIGLVNADTTAEAVITNVHPAGFIVSGVAGTSHRIGDVVIAEDWVQAGVDGVVPVNEALFALAERAAPSLPALENCALVPPGSASGATVCMPFQPALFIGGHGMSTDPYTGATPCVLHGGDILGCELPPAAALVSRDTTPPDVDDMETAAVAHRAQEHGVPFLGVRATSDGAGDPQGDRGFPRQFFDYYVLAAHNAATVTRTVVAELASIATTKRDRSICRLLGKRRWSKAAARLAPPP